MEPTKRDPGGQPPRQPEIPVIDDPAEPGAPKTPEMPPPVPDPPEVVGRGYGAVEQHYHRDGSRPASWQPDAFPARAAGHPVELC